MPCYFHTSFWQEDNTQRTERTIYALYMLRMWYTSHRYRHKSYCMDDQQNE